MKDRAQLVIKEKLMTSGNQNATTEFQVNLNGVDCSTNVVSRSVAKGNSFQGFYSKINGNNACAGHSECDAIIMDEACVTAVPEITANHVDASLIHEGCHWQNCRRTNYKIDDIGIITRRSRGRNCSWLFKIVISKGDGV